jgi:hypothetical protein
MGIVSIYHSAAAPRLACLFALVGLSHLAGGTSVILVRTDEHIVVGSDSLWSGKPPKHLCKIKQVGPVYFAGSGLYEESNTGFSLQGIAADAIKNGGYSVIGSARYFAAHAAPVFAQTATAIRDHDPSEYQHLKGPEALQIVFFGMTHGQPSYAFVSFTIKNDTGEVVGLDTNILECPGNDCVSGGLRTILLGEIEAAMRLKDDPTLFSNGDIEAVRKGIKAEIADKPQSVGPPIEIVVIDAKGEHWIEGELCGHPHEIHWLAIPITVGIGAVVAFIFFWRKSSKPLSRNQRRNQDRRKK